MSFYFLITFGVSKKRKYCNRMILIMMLNRIFILNGWSAKKVAILQTQNLAFRLQHIKFSVIGMIPRLWCSYYLKLQN